MKLFQGDTPRNSNAFNSQVVDFYLRNKTKIELHRKVQFTPAVTVSQARKVQDLKVKAFFLDYSNTGLFLLKLSCVFCLALHIVTIQI